MPEKKRDIYNLKAAGFSDDDIKRLRQAKLTFSKHRSREHLTDKEIGYLQLTAFEHDLLNTQEIKQQISEEGASQHILSKEQIDTITQLITYMRDSISESIVQDPNAWMLLSDAQSDTVTYIRKISIENLGSEYSLRYRQGGEADGMLHITLDRHNERETLKISPNYSFVYTPPKTFFSATPQEIDLDSMGLLNAEVAQRVLSLMVPYTFDYSTTFNK